MKKRFSMENLDCANCAAKMEAAIRRIDGVESAVVSFMTQKLTIEADEARFEEILDQAAAGWIRTVPSGGKGAVLCTPSLPGSGGPWRVSQRRRCC